MLNTMSINYACTELKLNEDYLIIFSLKLLRRLQTWNITLSNFCKLNVDGLYLYNKYNSFLIKCEIDIYIFIYISE